MNTKAKFYDSAYPGSMSQRVEGGYVERTDSASLAEALLQNLQAAQDSVEDWKTDALRLEKELAEMTKERDELAEVLEKMHKHFITESFNLSDSIEFIELENQSMSAIARARI